MGVDAEKDGDTERLYLAEACVEDVLKAGRYDDYEVVEELSGEEMVGWAYDHPLAEVVPDHAHGEGSGRCTPPTTSRPTARASSTPRPATGGGLRARTGTRPRRLRPVGSDGVYTDDAGKYAGTFVRDANDEVIDDLDENGVLLSSEPATPPRRPLLAL